MAYIDKEYYDSVFKGIEIPEGEFERLADIASDVISEVSIQEITDEDAITNEVKKATAYEVEFLYEYGGLDAILGYANIGGESESLGDYSVSSGSQVQKPVQTIGGIPVSTMAIVQLRKAGLMKSWLFARSDRGES